MEKSAYCAHALLILLFTWSCSKKENIGTRTIHKDVAYLQDYSIKFDLQDESLILKAFTLIAMALYRSIPRRGF